jgi:hypothetical protein
MLVDTNVLAIIIVLILFFMMWQQNSKHGGHSGSHHGSHHGSEHFHNRHHSNRPSCSSCSNAHPRELLSNQLDYLQDRLPAHHAPRPIGRHRMPGPPSSSESSMQNSDRITMAEREQWETPSSSYDHMSNITDLVIDPRTQEQHRQWVNNMSPFSGRPMMADNVEEAFAQSHPFVGFSRPHPVAQNNPLQVTEADHSTFAGSKRVIFNG